MGNRQIKPSMNKKFTVVAILASVAASQACIPNDPTSNECDYAPTVWEIALELADANYIQYKKGCTESGTGTEPCKLWEAVNAELEDVPDSLW